VASSGKRTRGPNKQTPWSRHPDDGTSVVRLALDTSDPVHRRCLESMFWTGYQVRRALQRQARGACQAYWAATHERAGGAASVRDRLGLSRTALEHAAYSHLDAAPHLRRHVTKALAMHLADTVWTPIERHLFRDASGARQGLLRVGRFHDFTRLPGRARSHTTEKKWETFRLHGTLDGHRAAYTDRTGRFVQPRRMRPVVSDAWWSHEGPLAVVFSGLPGGTLTLPVRLPTAPSSQAHLDHHLRDPSRWHKIDLVRRQDPSAPGGWSYEAHLMVLVTPYASPATIARRAQAAIATADRSAGLDANVSNLTIASHRAGSGVMITRIDRTEATEQRERSRAKRDRRRQRALERSRRAMNRAQYQLSKRQAKRARRRAEAGLRALDVIPAGPRITTGAGRPVQRYRADQRSRTYRRLDAARAWDAASAAQARRDQARTVAGNTVATHGYHLVVEDVRLSSWSASWGRAVAAFSPGTLIAAIDREARAVGAVAGGHGGVVRASTATTALSQHCPCGARVDKRLADRVHACAACGLRADRDAISAVLASFVVFVDEAVPASARVDYAASATALGAIRRAVTTSSYQGWQDTLSESTGLSARDGSYIAWKTPTPDPVVVARRNAGMAACSTRNETGSDRTTSERIRWRTGKSHSSGTYVADLWDNS
jgi:hypothetical protein